MSSKMHFNLGMIKDKKVSTSSKTYDLVDNTKINLSATAKIHRYDVTLGKSLNAVHAKKERSYGTELGDGI
ncbi:hypothetical protein POVWA2_088130 [Plasmodium ovale wallikeri]|uniref:Uncharacterized protein n=1 Tax=Plasmodium ovale wallikeri TaxID=864142 RepID=A0A1A9ARR9_PLAOA|nr:hypothetical protein POVWA1_068310 [Plasmodium ovale wallikeri]SBT58817.1 hypothetical protein POVWA2_088130 [Plasmodium ovale wallikeri]